MERKGEKGREKKGRDGEGEEVWKEGRKGGRGSLRISLRITIVIIRVDLNLKCPD